MWPLHIITEILFYILQPIKKSLIIFCFFLFFRFFTYGDFPLEGHLEYINNNYLQKFDRIDIDTSVPNEPRWQQMVGNSFPGF